MFKRGTLFSLVLCGTGLMTLSAGAQSPYSTQSNQAQQYSRQRATAAHYQPAGQLRPVPSMGSRHVAPKPAHNPTHSGWNLKWGRPAKQVVSAPEPVSRRPLPQQPNEIARVSHSEPIRVAEPQAVQPAAWIQPQTGTLELPADLNASPAAAEPNGGFFNPSNPFGNPQAAAQNAPAEQLEAPAIQPAQTDQLGNQLRDEANTFDLPAPNQETEVLPEPAPSQPEPAQTVEEGPENADSNRSLRDLLQQESPSDNLGGDPEVMRPETGDEFGNPFDTLRPGAGDDATGPGERKTPYKTRSITCEDFRERIARDKITMLSLDPSPPFRPDVIDEAEFEKLKGEFDDRQVIRTWRNPEGRELASGRLRDLAYERVLVETEYGSIEELPMDSLSEADLEYLSSNWGLPKQCLLEQVAFQPRNWAATTMTWKASDLCHKPLYFEQVNLERYGHTAGPVLQPAVSSAHFFLSVIVLPYKMGVHTPVECQYALGYYRPGDCAPWIVPPVPISLRGGLSQAAATTGLFWLVP